MSDQPRPAADDDAAQASHPAPAPLDAVWGAREMNGTAPVVPPAPAGPSPAPTASALSIGPTTIGRLTRVRGSDLWPDGTGLAAWLSATPEPLADAIGKGPFEFAMPDGAILLGTSADQQPVCVVCEVGPTSDDMLGVLLRIAAVQEGGIVAWVAGETRDAQIAALSWLNRQTSPRFYLVRVTGIRIDTSASAPIFELVTRPARGGASDAPRDGDDAPRRRAEDHVQDD